ncbi:MAG: Bcr/CflA family drug resistance efflux transporter [Ponticaulis sp.]|nr:Bcr/CflA family drug resistance efflux transporter [Ponticaulis sp.]
MSAKPNILASHSISTPEFVAMTACLMALNALAIDVMLPALSRIAVALEAQHENDAQNIVLVYMVGFGLSQLFWGPITDRFGRRPVLRLVLVGYVVTAIGCTLSDSFNTLLIWRFLLGIFAGGTRVIAVSVVRDLFVGRGMARIMSLVMTVFMVVPILAPMVGAQIMNIIDVWQSTFGVLAIGGAAMLVWSWFRLPETRPPEKRTAISLSAVGSAYARVFMTRDALGYMIGSGVIFGSLMAYISSSEQIYTDVFGLTAEQFTICFAVIAGAMSISTFMNSTLVEKLGQRLISHTALIGFTLFALILVVTNIIMGPNLYVFMAMFSLVFMNFGFMGPNFNSMAMEPLGDVAGYASGVLGFASTTLAALIGGAIAHQYNGSITPVLWGFVVLGMVTIVIVFWTEHFSLFGAKEAEASDGL